VRSLLYKLRLTWGGSYQVFTPTVLHQLDVKIKKIDPAWPVTHPKQPAPSAPVPIDRSASNTKIHVNPNFVSKTVKEKTPPMEDETERMRAELLKKEAELIKLKQMQLDMQILQLKKEMPAKVNISMKLTSSVPVERRESVLSQPSDSEEACTEFDVDAVVVPVKTQEQLDVAKPRLKGKKFTVMPPMTKDSDLSGLCSIM